ncbi:hypothetical protein [Pseudoponticoccus marisrubri]|uniref:YARHG domain-containing protein n=1 Tax=Pseudoponticoccus marisrubri TaxID=1685382 RepID=A0A0W7WFY3_9RHOB|nr:hypothetical protein [Pseudoponticoccus marisrubri]KUF09412.1 hypothetical protein AVJ23_17365 [Pseudoponticoccus marisrubri]
MKLLNIAAIGAFALAASTVAGAADHHKKKHYQRWGYSVHDTACDKHLCYTPYTPYSKGHYGHIRCKDVTKRLTYVDGHLDCVPRKTAVAH